MRSMVWRRREKEENRLRRKVRLAIALLLVIWVLAATAIYSFAAGMKILKTDLDGGVPAANPRVGHPDNILPDGFTLQEIARGTDPLENASGVITKLGLLSDGTFTEPDINTYLVLDHNPGGPTPHYDYGRRFLFQGHENANDLAYITRINLDVDDPAHRITLLTPVGGDGKTHFNRIDGSAWNPFTETLLFTQENGNAGGVIEIPADYGTPARTLHGILGQGGYEGIHPDNRGNLYIAEDVGGTSVSINPNDATANPKVARNPNSFIYRFVPKDVTDLSAGGRLQALQVSIDGSPLVFVPVNGAHPFGDVFSDNQLKLHTLGTSWPATWVTIHDTDINGTNAFDANAAAKSAGATPFKRPENLKFLPGSGFNTFFFTATGDTDQRAGNVAALAARGAWGSLFRVDFSGGGDTGTVSIFALGDQDHTSFDNVAFFGTSILLTAEDRGDTLHDQMNRLDSVWAYDVRKPGADPVRFIALGRDSTSETVQHEDNEPTGIIYSDGAASTQSLLGKPVNPTRGRLFFTQQHGDNVLWEVLGSH
jgi:Alkaline phosphatase PhoX